MLVSRSGFPPWPDCLRPPIEAQPPWPKCSSSGFHFWSSWRRGTFVDGSLGSTGASFFSCLARFGMFHFSKRVSIATSEISIHSRDVAQPFLLSRQSIPIVSTSGSSHSVVGPCLLCLVDPRCLFDGGSALMASHHCLSLYCLSSSIPDFFTSFSHQASLKTAFRSFSWSGCAANF